ncbi:hypothetical protein CERSUDRAFT_99246 [Gelatoporia subvermispora B]|uniref:Uncharacterized protein n=1 Tax=Ceriporiopsis subvermispora (strain B) TaxID=914234 RepID=M2Q6S0_CERS8|nr:hypothetical protein CERSUDRAFT_99246 [Gelatoporia subvermispora B]
MTTPTSSPTHPPALASPAFASGDPPLSSTRMQQRSSRSLVISPNLFAALEYDERTRAAQQPPSSPALVPGGGLPPPPRPKSRVRSPPRSPNPGPSTSKAPSAWPTASPAASSPPVSGPSLSENPYINPAPRLSYLLRSQTVGASSVQGQGSSDPDDHESERQGTADRDRGPPAAPASASETHGSAPNSPSTSGTSTSARLAQHLPATAPNSPPTTTDGHAHGHVYGHAPSQSLPASPSFAALSRPAFKSHRYWASLHKVERMLGLGRRMSVAELPDSAPEPCPSGTGSEGAKETGKERGKGKEKDRRMKESARVPASAPSSPVVHIANSVASAAEGGRRGSMSSTTSSTSRGERALAALSPRVRLEPYIAETDAVALAVDVTRRRGVAGGGDDDDGWDAAGRQRQAAGGTATTGRRWRETEMGSHDRSESESAANANANGPAKYGTAIATRVSPPSQSVSPRTSVEASSSAASASGHTKSNMSMSTCDTAVTSVHPHSTDSRDPRISISSTIYPTESQASHDHHDYHEIHEPVRAPTSPRPRPLPSPPTQPRRSSTSSRADMSSRSPDRESFIDFASPTSPDYPHPYTSFAQSMSPHESYVSPSPSASLYAQSTPPGAYRRSSEHQNRHEHRTSPDQRSNTDPVRSSARPQLSPLAIAGQKPPIPTAPKPHFRRSRSAQPPTDPESHHDGQTSGHPASAYPQGHAHGGRPDAFKNLGGELSRGLPPTTNLLNPRERADGVRKTRKLTHLFGRTPGATLGADADPPDGDADDPLSGCLPAPKSMNLAMKRRHQKGAASMLEVVTAAVGSGGELGPTKWPPGEADGPAAYLALGPRRHSSPMTPGDFAYVVDGRGSEDGDGDGWAHVRSSVETWRSMSTMDGDGAIEIGTREGEPSSEWDSHIGHGGHSGEKRTSGPTGSPTSPTSFIDLSDDDSKQQAPPRGRHARPHFGHHHALSDSPLATPRPGAGFAPGTPSVMSVESAAAAEGDAEDERRRKRERLAKLHRFLGSRVPPHLVLGLDPADDLPPPAPEPPADMHDSDEDRRVRIRRRRSSSAAEFARSWSDEIDRLKEDLNDKEKAINVRRAVKMEKMFGVAPPQTLYHTRQVASSPATSSALWEPPSPRPVSPRAGIPGLRNVNQSSYRSKGKKGTKDGRPGTSESSKPLIATGVDDGRFHGEQHMSDVYLHYQHSLNSLNDIIDRDDKESLAELHDYLSGTLDADDDHAPLSPPAKSERRRSLPSRTSLVSLASEFSIAPSPPAERPDGDEFQLRRRRAAKLTAFFGVNYRDLMGEILESIEKGLEEERGRGTLRADEAQDLLQRLMNLKSKRNSLS